MQRNKETKILDYVLKTSSFINILSSLILTKGIGIFYLTIKRNSYEFSTLSITMMASVFLTLGALSVMINIYGLAAAKRSQYITLLALTFVLYLIFFMVLSFSLWCIIVINSKNKFNDKIKNNMVEIINNYKEVNETKYETLKFNWLQNKFNCCGVESYEDWKSHLSTATYINYKRLNNDTLIYLDDVPDTCCIEKTKNCGKVYSDDKISNLNSNGCYQIFLQHSIESLNIISIFGIVLSLINLISTGVLGVVIFRSLIIKYKKIST